MRFSTSGSFPRFDYSLLVEALPALREEWAALTFGSDGAVINPLRREPRDELRLVEGRHRAPGARYEVLMRTPVTQADPDQEQALQRELLGGPDIDWDEYGRRLAEITRPTGEITESITRFTLRQDDSRSLAVTVADPTEHWSVDVEMVHARMPRIVVAGRADATAMLMAQDAPRWLARRVGGEATGTATVDLAMFEQRAGGTVGEAAGRVKLLRGSGSATVTPTPTTWDVAASAELTGKGLGRLALRLFRKRLQRSFDTAAAAYWANVPTSAETWEKERHRVEEVVAAEGGLATVIHRALWDPAYLEAITVKYDLE
ncbi:hypothetical protein [Aeromicrobium stalagmiti]|uniref:hypothetical protein n=1 Tax=Aeromicrobium stalagmiti TaxID=2738988 RepID=UPI001568B608|nr:hypothetical protein [Aeromicrobium stalagmiti]NRQ48947.1 hypothetical protein [Aeromicrobium stalagmiti]